METKSKGYVIVNYNHPNNPNRKNIFENTFRYTKRQCIKNFVDGTGRPYKVRKSNRQIKNLTHTSKYTCGKRKK